MQELEKAARGMLYDANYNPDLLARRKQARRLLHRFNLLSPDDEAQKSELVRALLGKTGERFVIEGPFHCDYGFNIEIGENFYANVNLVILDGAKVCIGNNVFLGPNVGLYTAGHPLDAARRNAGLEYALPITIGDDVWIGGGVSILPGVRIGHGVVVGSGAVVTRDIPDHVICAGNPAKVIRPIGDRDAGRETFSRI